MEMHPVFVILFLLGSQAVLSDVTLDPFRALEEINDFSGLPPVRTPCSQEGDCPIPLKALNKKASRAFIYRVVHSDFPINKCLKNRSMPPASELEGIFTDALEGGKALGIPISSSCGAVMEEPAQQKSLLVIQQQYYRERLKRGAIQSLLAMHEIDAILDVRPSGMNSVICNSSISLKVKEACQKLKQCPANNQRDVLVDLTFVGLEKRQELANELSSVRRKITYYKRKNQRNGGNRKDIQHLKTIRNTLKASIAEIDSMIPWTQGRIFKKNLSRIEKNIQKKEDPLLVKKQIEAGLLLQSQANKRQLLRYYDQFGEAGRCLRGDKTCDRFPRIIKKTPPILPFENPYEPSIPPDIQKAYKQFEIVQCLEKEVGKAKVYNSIAQGAGEIALGLAIGGAGGIYSLGINAARVLRHGYRLKGALSLMGLGTLGITSYKNFNLLKLKCKEASRHIAGLRQMDSQVACISLSYPQNVSQYLSCLTELALTAAAVVPPVLGKGIRMSSKSKKMQSGGKKYEPGGVKSEKELDELQNLLGNQERTEFTNLLDEFNPEEIGMIRPYFKFVKESDVDPLVLYRALRYSRILSPQKRIRFLSHLDEALKREADSVNRNVRTFAKGENRYIKRAAKLEKTYKKKLPSSVTPQRVRELAKRKSHEVEDVMLSCRARNMNPSHKRGISLFGKITTGMTGLSIVSGFSNTNWHLPKDTEWFGRLGYELVYAMMYTKIMVKVMKNPSSNMLKRYAQFNAGATLVAGVDAGIYSQFFDINEDDARDTLNRIKNSPQNKKDLEKLSQYLDKTNFVEAFKKSVANNFKNMIKHRQKSSDKIEEGLIEGLENLTEKDLDDPRVQDRLLEGVMAQYYDSKRGYFNLGMGTDRFSFNRLWSASMGIPKDIALALPLYYSLCMTAIYPVGGMMAAAGIQTLNQFATYDLYYRGRSKMINQ